MRTIDAGIIAELESSEFSPFYLLHLSIDDTDYRYTDCDVPITFDSNTHAPLGFSFQSAQYSVSRIVDKIQIKIDNLDSVMTSIFVGGTPQGAAVELSIVLYNASGGAFASSGTLIDTAGVDLLDTAGEDLLDTVSESGASTLSGKTVIFDGEIDSWQLNEESLKVTVTSILARWSQRTLSKHPKSCRWKVFKGTECQYAGAETWCDRTHVRCTALSNTAHYGGFRWLPSLVDKDIWWGKKPK